MSDPNPAVCDQFKGEARELCHSPRVEVSINIPTKIFAMSHALFPEIQMFQVF